MKRFALMSGLLLCACGDGAMEAATDVGSQTQEDGLASAAFVSRSGRQLRLNNAEVRFVGTNRYDLAGGPQTDLCSRGATRAGWAAWVDGILKQAASDGTPLLRLWAFQNFAGPSGTDFSYFDHVVATAKKYKVKLILVLENTWGDCSQGGTKDAAWFSSGYKGTYGYAQPFPTYVDNLVKRFKDEPAIAMWQIMNEGKLFEQPELLRGFLVDIARRIRAIDKNHLISGGAAIQCWQGEQGALDFARFNDDANIDVLDAHDYEDEEEAMPACMAAAKKAADQLNKPLIIGEAGMGSRKFGLQSRADHICAKMRAAAAQGVGAYLIWHINDVPNYNDDLDYFADDPLTEVLRTAASTYFQSSSATATPPDHNHRAASQSDPHPFGGLFHLHRRGDSQHPMAGQQHHLEQQRQLSRHQPGHHSHQVALDAGGIQRRFRAHAHDLELVTQPQPARLPQGHRKRGLGHLAATRWQLHRGRRYR